MAQKAVDYAGPQDRLRNFRRVAAGRPELTPMIVAHIWLMKQIDAIENAVFTGNISWCWRDEHGNEGLKQRFMDARNYLLLIAACIDEQFEGKRK